MAAIRHCLTALTMLAAAACGSRGAGSSAGAGPPRWTGSFKQVAASAVIGADLARARASGYGAITLTPLSSETRRVRVDLSISTSVSGTQIAWAVFSGTCGTPSPPILAVNEFPTIDVGNNGNGLVRAELPMSLDPRGIYHANVYWSSRATDVSNVMLCANLSRVSGR